MLDKKNQTNTYLEARARIAKRILTSPLAQHLKFGRQRELEQYMADEKENLYGYIGTDFERAGSDCSLVIEAKVADRLAREPEVDDDGNEWREYKLGNVEINWPCHGGTDVGVALARLEFYKDVARLGADIMGEFGNRELWRLEASAAEVHARNERYAREKQERALKDLVAAHTKGLRKNNFQLVCSADTIPLQAAGLSGGPHSVTYAGKEFAVCINAAWQATIERVT